MELIAAVLIGLLLLGFGVTGVANKGKGIKNEALRKMDVSISVRQLAYGVIVLVFIVLYIARHGW